MPTSHFWWSEIPRVDLKWGHSGEQPHSCWVPAKILWDSGVPQISWTLFHHPNPSPCSWPSRWNNNNRMSCENGVIHEVLLLWVSDVRIMLYLQSFLWPWYWWNKIHNIYISSTWEGLGVSVQYPLFVLFADPLFDPSLSHLLDEQLQILEIDALLLVFASVVATVLALLQFLKSECPEDVLGLTHLGRASLFENFGNAGVLQQPQTIDILGMVLEHYLQQLFRVGSQLVPSDHLQDP